MKKNITILLSYNQTLGHLAISFQLEKDSKGYMQLLQSLF